MANEVDVLARQARGRIPPPESNAFAEENPPQATSPHGEADIIIRMGRTRQTQDELEAFDDFIGVAGLKVKEGSIRKQHPPQPDIHCHIVGSGPLAFELAQIIDPDMKQQHEWYQMIDGKLNSRAKTLPAEKRRALRTALKDANINVEPRDGARKKDLDDGIGSLLDQLLYVKPDQGGEIPLVSPSPQQHIPY